MKNQIMAVSVRNPQAEESNRIIKENSPIVYSFLSAKGRAIFFPKDGILGQSAEAKNTRLNATIGIALEDDGSPVRFSFIADKIKLPPKDVFSYAPGFGKPELRQVWLEDLKKKNPSLKSQTSLPMVTNALTHALNVIAYLFIDPNDKIIIPDKFWGNYRLIFEHAYGATLDTFNTFAGNGFDIKSFAKKLKDSAKEKTIILFNFPNNPTGYTLTEKEAKEIVKIIKTEAENGRKMIVLCDDAYFGLVYEKGILKESLFSFLSDLHKNVLAIKADGATKEQYVWGFRVGFITYGGKGITQAAYQALEGKTGGAIRGSISSAPHPSQSLVLLAFASSDYKKEKKEKYELLKSRYEKVREVVQNPKYKKFFSPLPFNSGYFMCLVLKETIKAEEVRKILISRYSTGVIAIKNLLRIAFSSVVEKDIPALFENIYSACKNP